MAALTSFPPELLVDIFLHLDYFDLTRLRRVCRRFSEVVEQHAGSSLSSTLFRRRTLLEHDPRVISKRSPSLDPSAIRSDTYLFTVHPYIHHILSPSSTPQNSHIPSTVASENALSFVDILQTANSSAHYDHDVLFAYTHIRNATLATLATHAPLQSLTDISVPSFLSNLSDKDMKRLKLWYGLSKECKYACYRRVLDTGRRDPYMTMEDTERCLWEMAEDREGYARFGVRIGVGEEGEAEADGGFPDVRLFLVKNVGRVAGDDRRLPRGHDHSK